MAHALDSYAAERARTARFLHAADGFARLRDEAWRQFVSMGFPTTQQEEWRFTSVASIADGGFMLAEPPESPALSIDIDPFRMTDVAAELVFVEGHYAASLSRSTDFRATPCRAGIRDGGRRALGLHLARPASF
jgi:Fe-S cluster assembly protein SufD